MLTVVVRVVCALVLAGAGTSAVAALTRAHARGIARVARAQHPARPALEVQPFAPTAWHAPSSPAPRAPWRGQPRTWQP